jgi:cytochrome c-type protein NapC
MGWLKRLWGFLFSPTSKYSVATLLAGGLVVGVAGVIGFEYALHATSTEEFCTSCHEMADNPAMMLEGTTHFMNESGVRPTCSDCHVPKEFVPKMVRKIQASREVWGAITGKIDTAEKYAAHAPEMKAREIARLKANDSQECRNCHDVKQMDLAQQSKKAQSFHKVLATGKRTCIDCHAGLTHTPPEEKVSLASP